MKNNNLKERTKKFTLRILNLAGALPSNDEGRIMRKQIIRSGTSVGSNYRAVCRSRSRADFNSKMGIVIEEADETAFWLEVIIERKLIQEELVSSLLKEANEIIAIMVSSRKTSVNNKEKNNS